MEGNWAELPPELINLIASRIIATDCLRLVCKSWNDAVASSSSVPTCQLMSYCGRTKMWRFHRQGDLFVSFPQLNSYDNVRCSKYGWLLVSRSDKTLFFLNPSSNRTISIGGRIGFGYRTLFFVHPPTSPDCTIVGFHTLLSGGEFVQTRVLARVGGEGEGQWETQKHPTKTEFSMSNGPPIVHRGQIFFLDVRGNVARFDVTNRRLVTGRDNCLTRHELKDQIREHYLFKLDNDESLFSVFVFCDEWGDNKEVVKVFRLFEKKMKWRLVEDIGDNVVFLSCVSSISYPCSCLANRIYFPRLSRGFDSPVFYSLTDAKFHPDNNNAFELGRHSDHVKKLGRAAWLRTTAPELTPQLFLN